MFFDQIPDRHILTSLICIDSLRVLYIKTVTPGLSWDRRIANWGECSRWSVIAILLFYDIHYSVYNLLCLIICFTGLPYKLFYNNVKHIPHWEETLSPVGSHTFLARARVSCQGR